MKKLFIFYVFLACGLCSLNAQISEYVLFNTDVKDNSGTNIIPKGSVQKLDLYVEILSATKKSDNTKGNVVPGEHFQVYEKNSALKKVHFHDLLNKDRYDCAEIKLCYKVDNSFIPFDGNDMIVLDQNEIFEDSSFYENITNKCRFNKQNRSLIVDDAAIGIFVDNKIYDKIATIPEGVNTVRLFKLTNNGLHVPDYSLNLDKCTIQPAEEIEQNLAESDKSLNLILVIAIISIVVIATICLLVKKQRNKTHRTKFINDEDMKKNKHAHTKQKNEHLPNKPYAGHEQETQKEEPINHVSDSSQTNPNLESVINEVKKLNYDSKFSSIERLISSVESKLSRQEQTIELIRGMVSNTDDKKMIEKLREQNNTISSSNKELEEKNQDLLNTNKNLNEEIKSLHEKAKIPDAYSVSSVSSLISFFRNMKSICDDADSAIMEYWSSLNSSDKTTLQFFMSNYWNSRMKAPISKWEAIITCLDLNGIVKIPEYSSYLKDLSPEVRSEFLFKRYFEEIVRPYYSSMVLILEQLRTANKLGVSTSYNANFSGLINAICTKCSEMKISIDYKELYEPITDYGTLDIETELPKEIESVFSNVTEQEVLLVVNHYAVNSLLFEQKEKTSCIVLM